MTKPGKAKASGGSPENERDADASDREDRDTVELDAGTLSRLRQFDGDAAIADRDTLELSAAESLLLARHSDRSSPFASGEVPVPPPEAASDDAGRAPLGGLTPANHETDGDSASEEEEGVPPTELLAEPPKSVRTLADVEAEGDRSSMLTIPSPPTFEEET